MLKAKNRQMWVFKDELVQQYHGTTQNKRNAPYASEINRIERYVFSVSDPAAELVAYRVMHTRNSS